MKKYSIGLDIGTTSVGWAVVDEENYEVMKKGKKSLWGVRLFDEATTAESRRAFRSTRRRFDRRRERIRLLQEEFNNEINKVDKDFFVKMKESFYNERDINNKKHPLSKEEKELVIKYNEKYPTIYHLRNELINNKEKQDIRLVYLVIHHIIKYRGNFLQEGKEFNVDNLDIKGKLREMFTCLSNCSEVEFPEDCINNIPYNELESALLNPSKNDKKLLIKQILDKYLNNNTLVEMIKMLVGYRFDVVKLFNLDSDAKLSISFEGTDFDDKLTDIENVIGEKTEVLSIMKNLYDTIYLKTLFNNSSSASLSDLMVNYYKKHEKDLKFLKEIFNYDDRAKKNNLYDKLFRTKRSVSNKKNLSDKDACLYDRYIHNGISYEEFIKELKKYLSEVLECIDNQKLLDKYTLEVQPDMENGTFLPRITSTSNGKYPYQLNKSELIKIIENQGKYYPFLLEKVNDEYKLVKLLEFKIPYYVGPLIDTSDKDHPFAWMEKKTKNVKITPYNFDEVVDKDKSAEKFITKMVGHCTYLLNEIALPTNSLLFSEYKVRNELKQIKVNNDKLTIEQQEDIIENFFKKTIGTLTDKKFKNYLKKTNNYDMYGDEISVTGYSADGKFANTLQTYIDFFGENGFFNNTNLNDNDAEEIIEWITIFTDKDILIKKIKEKYNLSDDVVSKIARKNYKGWGSLSRKLLTEKYYYDESTSTKKSILDLMKETDKNFMQIINEDEYNFQKMIADNNTISNTDKLDYKLVEDLATSPAIKRGIWQSLKVVEELVDYIGYEPSSISIEMAREDGKKGRKVDRKKYLTKLYEEAKEKSDEYNTLMQQLRKQEKLDSDMLYLYFLQEGKCLYSGEPLDINNLSNDCEIDHILPRTLVKDDSFNNRALVLRKYNQDKKASLVLPNEWINKNNVWWRRLSRIGLMSNTKLYRLTRRKYEDEDIRGFINRQLVETRQITKHVANILGNFHKDSEIIYLKADVSHSYREKFGLYKFRELNDYHHAFDAYLASVLGLYKRTINLDEIDYKNLTELNHRLYESKKYKELKYGYVINSIDEEFTHFNKETGEILDINNFIKTIDKYYYRNDILISRKTEIKTGEFFRQTKLKKGNLGIPLKNNMKTEYYGAYDHLAPAYAVMVRYNKKEKIVQRMIGIPIYYINQQDKSLLDAHIREKLSLSENDNYSIISKPIPFYSEFDWNGMICSLVGASDKVEVCNAKEFKLKKNEMKKYSEMLNRLYNHRKKSINDLEYSNKLSGFINLIVKKVENEYELYKNLVPDMIEMFEDNESFTIEEKENVVIQILNLLGCNSVNANFKFLNSKYSSAFGRKHARTIENVIIVNKSVTGLKVNETVIDFGDKYEF